MANQKIKLRTGDKVVVLTGKDKGKTGKIIAVETSSNAVVVEGVNIVSRHKKPKSAKDKGGIVKESKINVSNVEILCPDCKKATKISYGEENGKKFRKCKKCGASLDKGIEIKKSAKADKKVEKKEVKSVATKIDKPEIKAPKRVVKDTTKKISANVTTKKTAVRKTADKKG